MAQIEADQEPSIEEILESIRQIISDEDEEQAVEASDKSDLDLSLTEEVVEKGPEVDLRPDEEATDKGGADLSVEETNDSDKSNLDLSADEDAADKSNLDLSPDDDDADASDLDLSPDEEDADGAGRDDVLELTELVDDGEARGNSNMGVDDIDAMFDEAGGGASSDEMPSKPIVDDMTPNIAMDDIDLVDEDDNGAGIISDIAAEATTDAMAHLASNMYMEHDDPNRVITPGRITLEDVVRDMLRPMLKTWIDSNLPNMVEKLVKRELDKISKNAQGR